MRRRDGLALLATPPSSVHARAARLVELPVGATEDRLVGSLDLERALAEGVRAYEPGLLAEAHRGVLYVDEVNLLHDHLVDLLLDAAAMGRAHVERDGVSVSHAAPFLLVGTMNPEEGELRPQLLDRFGLTVEVRASRDVDTRVEVVRRRLAFEADPAAFAATFAEAEAATARRIADARARLAAVVLPDAELRRIAAVCAAFDVDGMRADLVIARAATAHAAWRGADAVAKEDVRAAARLALPHRRRRDPFDAPGLDEQALDEALDGADAGAGARRARIPTARTAARRSPAPTTRTAPRRSERGVGRVRRARRRVRSVAGRRAGRPATARDERRAPAVDAVPRPAARGPRRRRGRARPPVAGPHRHGRIVAPDARHAAARRRAAPARDRRAPPPRTRGPRPDRRAGSSSQRDDLRRAEREGREGNLVLFGVDASARWRPGSGWSAVKGAVLSLLLDAYQRRDKVGLVTFRGTGAEVVLPPTSQRRRRAGPARDAAAPAAGRRWPTGCCGRARLLRVERLRDPRRRAAARRASPTAGPRSPPARHDPVADACRAAGLAGRGRDRVGRRRLRDRAGAARPGRASSPARCGGAARRPRRAVAPTASPAWCTRHAQPTCRRAA